MQNFERLNYQEVISLTRFCWTYGDDEILDAINRYIFAVKAGKSLITTQDDIKKIKQGLRIYGISSGISEQKNKNQN